MLVLQRNACFSNRFGRAGGVELGFIKNKELDFIVPENKQLLGPFDENGTLDAP